MSLYIIFLGIVPTVSLIAFGIWYARNTDTGMKHWKKASGPMSTYVSRLDCFKPRIRSKPSVLRKNDLIQRVLSHAKRQPHVEPQKPTNISGTLQRDKIRIVKRDLVSTTNPEVINCSNEIEQRRSVCSTDDLCISDARNEEKRRSPLRTELGIKLAEHIRAFEQQQQQNQQWQPQNSKNFKGLTVKTDLKLQQLRGSSNVTPSTAASTAELVPTRPAPIVYNKKAPLPPTNKEPAPFYDKKPPPPPVPSQSNKPKI